MNIPFRPTIRHMTDRICHNFTTAQHSYKLRGAFSAENLSDDNELHHCRHMMEIELL